MTSERLILAIDQGTTNTKAILVDGQGRVVSQAWRSMDIEYPRPGWVQQDAERIWRAVRECLDECLLAAGSPALAAIGISNQRETGVAWQRTGGRPIGPAVTWQ
ncbi:MAG TPA: FGGY family carbohydrate kinase, partial [Candidatus Limnocylindrales bacterium]|nr:FGGY family carbohydrate kinase [Candidatus Limnocylindrales bacterium]